MKIKEIPEINSLFSKIGDLETFPFIDEFTDVLFIKQYGNIPVNDSILEDDAKSLAPLIVVFYSNRWQSVMDIEGMDVDGFDIRTIDETKDNTSDTTNSGTDTQKVAAYDDPALLDDAATERDNMENETANMTRTLKEKRSNLKTAYENLPYASRLNILNVAMLDVADFLKSDIF